MAEQQPYASERWASLMLDLRGWLTRPFMLRLLTEPHPDNGKNKDSLVCFAAVTDRVDGTPVVPAGSFTVVDEKTRGDASSVTLEQRTSEGLVGTATLHFVKQDVWRLDNVSCPKT